MLARDRCQDGERDGQGENIMTPLQAMVRGIKHSERTHTDQMCNNT